MVLAKMSTPAMVMNWIVSSVAVALAAYLYELEDEGEAYYYSSNPHYNSYYYYVEGSTFRKTPILVAAVIAGCAWGVFTLRLAFRVASACFKKEATCCRPEVASGLLLALDVVMSALVFSGAVVLVAAWPKNDRWSDFDVECQKGSAYYSWNPYETSTGCGEFHALQAMLWLLWLTTAVTVLCTAATWMQDRRHAREHETVFDDVESGERAVVGQSLPAAGQGQSESGSGAACCCCGSEPGVHTIILQQKRFTTAQFGVHIALWVAASLSLSLLASALAGEVGSWDNSYNFWDKFKPYDTPEVAFGLSASVVVWLVSTVYVCLSLCKVTVHPVAVLAADVVLLVLTLVSAGVANALGGVNCSGFSLCSQYISGVVFVWLSAVLYIVLLVLNVLAVVQTAALNIQQVNFVRQGEHNVDIVVGGGDQAQTQSQAQSQAPAQRPAEPTQAQRSSEPAQAKFTSCAKFTSAQFGLHVALWLCASLSLAMLAYAIAGTAEFYVWYGYFRVNPYDEPEVAFGLAASCALWLVATVYISLNFCKMSVRPMGVLVADVCFLVLTMVSAGVLAGRGGVHCGKYDFIDRGLCGTFASGVAFVWVAMAVQIALLVLDVMALLGLSQASVANSISKRFTASQTGVHAGVCLSALLALSLLSATVADANDDDDDYWYGYDDSDQYDTPEVFFCLAAACIVGIAFAVYLILGACQAKVHPVAKLAADAFLLLLTMMAEGVVFSLNGNVFSTYGSEASTFISGVAFAWIMMVFQIVALVLDVLESLRKQTAAPQEIGNGRRADSVVAVVVGSPHTEMSSAPGSGHFAVANPVEGATNHIAGKAGGRNFENF